jgi:TetR/AcrR family transcriptional regulator, transcriptional repressor for nem operon
MVLARSIEDRVLADEIREAAMSTALSLGQWGRAERPAATERRHSP